ncbi:MAG: alpha/beta hydrolase [Terrimonas sp.]|nr:alpha/beta hydrolase [Terrimonas sp.]
MKVYFIPGLGADRRVFKHIRLPNGFDPVYLEWLVPEKKESLKHYASRLSESIDDREDFVLCGLSFGGMLASEISMYKKPALLVLISSIPVSSQLPGYYRKAAAIGLHKIIPVSFFKSAALIKRIFTTETEAEKKMLREMIREVDPAFIDWALQAILDWKKEEWPTHYIHIHGASDELLPVRYTKPTHILQKAGHLAVLNQAAGINAILSAQFQGLVVNT